MALARAARTEEERILAPADEGAGGQVEDQAAVDLRVEGEVEIVESFVVLRCFKWVDRTAQVCRR